MSYKDCPDFRRLERTVLSVSKSSHSALVIIKAEKQRGANWSVISNKQVS